jgi:hypothetical protein
MQYPDTSGLLAGHLQEIMNPSHVAHKFKGTVWKDVLKNIKHYFKSKYERDREWLDVGVDESYPEIMLSDQYRFMKYLASKLGRCREDIGWDDEAIFILTPGYKIQLTLESNSLSSTID